MTEGNVLNVHIALEDVCVCVCERERVCVRVYICMCVSACEWVAM